MATALAAAAALALSCGRTSRPEATEPRSAVALTSGDGLATDPAVSADGRWLAYTADRNGTGSELWIRPVAGGDARQVTSGAAQATSPSFSADGSTLVYRSEADGGGIYVIPAQGGAPRLLVKDGRRPRYSPVGSRIAYWTDLGTGRSAVFLAGVPEARLTAVQPDFHTAMAPSWSPDGQRLIFRGCRSAAEDSCDWWVTPADGGEAIRTGAATLLRAQHIAATASPDLWTAGNAIVFAGKVGEKTRLWSLNLDPASWQATGTPRRLMSGDRDERSPAVGPDGRILFASRTENVDVWTLPLDANAGQATGSLSRVTTDPAIDQRPSLSADGRRVTWETSRGGNFEVWVKDLVSGKERGVTSGPLREHMPAMSRDGSKLVYDSHDGETVTVLEADFDGGDPVKVWEEQVGQGSFQWTPRGDAVLYFHREPPGTVGLMNLATKKRTVLMRHPRFNLSLADARLSPDGRAIAFPVPFAPHRTRLAVAHLSGKVIEDEKDWTYVTPESENASQPEWSPDGRRIYFLSDKNGRLAVWTIALSREMKAEGDAKLVLDLSGPALSIAEMRPRDIGLAVAKDKLALGAAEYRGGLWALTQ